MGVGDLEMAVVYLSEQAWLRKATEESSILCDLKKKKKKFQVKQKKVKGGEADFLAEMYFIRAWEAKWTFLEKGTVNG